MEGNSDREVGVEGSQAQFNLLVRKQMVLQVVSLLLSGIVERVIRASARDDHLAWRHATRVGGEKLSHFLRFFFSLSHVESVDFLRVLLLYHS